jgi:NTE family protein
MGKDVQGDQIVKPTIGIALGGGGVRGLAHIGVLKIFEEAKIPIGCIIGSSVGAIVAAMYANNPHADTLIDQFKRTLEMDFYQRVEDACKGEACGTGSASFLSQITDRMKKRIALNLAGHRSHLFSNEGMKQVLFELLPMGKIETSPIPLGIVITNLDKGQDVCVTQGDIFQTVLISSSVTGFLPPMHAREGYLTDGSASCPVPVKYLKSLGATYTVGIEISYSGYEPMSDPSVVDLVTRADAVRAERLADLMVREADLQIRPDTGDVHWSQFSRFEECLQAGIKAGEAALPLLERIAKPTFWQKIVDYFALHPPFMVG